jgi:hypothetical protein
MSEPRDHLSTPLDRLTWCIATRQFDMLVRHAAATVIANGTVRGRVRKDAKLAAVMIEKAADAAWQKLRTPPDTVGEAYQLDDEVGRTWPKIKGAEERARPVTGTATSTTSFCLACGAELERATPNCCQRSDCPTHSGWSPKAKRRERMLRDSIGPGDREE